MQNGDCATVAECQRLLETANRRLLKTIADLDAAIDAGNTKLEVVQAHKLLRDLLKEALVIKDQMIADLKANNDFLRKDRAGKTKSWIRRAFETAAKIALVVVGIKIGMSID